MNGLNTYVEVCFTKSGARIGANFIVPGPDLTVMVNGITYFIFQWKVVLLLMQGIDINLMIP